LHISWTDDAVRVTKWFPRQASLTPSRRRRNMQHAFTVSQNYDFNNAHIIVVDDVLTTGTTANTLAQTLRRAGAATVRVAVIARGIGWA
jgi:predicted amidophosphoribosyltransferase